MPAASRHLFLDNQSRSRLAVIGLIGAMAYSAIDLAMELLGLTDAASGRRSFGLALLLLLLAIVGLGFTIFSIVAFVRWFGRAYGNALAIGLRAELGQGWAIGGWFVPIANLFVPFRIAIAMWRQAGEGRVGAAAVVGAWWALFLGSGVSRSMGAIMSLGPKQRGVELSVILISAGAIMRILSGLPAITIIRRLTAAQDEMQLLARANEAFGEEPPPLPAGMPSAPPVAVSTVPGERPVAGSACGHCGARIDTDYDAFVCRDCDMPLHEDCLREGACPQCRGRDLDAGFRFY